MPDKKSPEDNKQRVLTKSRSSVTSSISQAVVAKDENLFFLTQPDADVPSQRQHGFGLYHEDCRYLRTYLWRLNGLALNALSGSAREGDVMRFYLSNPDFRAGGTLVPKEAIGLSIERRLDGKAQAVKESLTFTNYLLEPLDLQASLELDADFSDVFAIRGLLDDHPGKEKQPKIAADKSSITFEYDSADKRKRRLKVSFDPPPKAIEDQKAVFDLHMQGRQSCTLKVALEIEAGPLPESVLPRGARKESANLEQKARGAANDWFHDATRVVAPGTQLEAAFAKSFRDLSVLLSTLAGRRYISAGVPWFATLFGRDSLISALETLPYSPRLAEETLLLLASLQGQKSDQWTEEQPGKILHEERTGELAAIHEVPYTPYYGSVDATPLFIITCAQHAKWTGRLDVFRRLRQHIDLALEWIDKYGDTNGDGFIDYAVMSSKGLVNEGWKDSSDAMVDEHGHVANPPLAPVEVQGYAYAAKSQIASLYEMCGDPDRAQKLRRQAEDLKRRINEAYWLKDKNTYAMALEKDGRPLSVLNSNAGQLLWTGAADEDKASLTGETLMHDAMFTGWGIRTLGKHEPAYNPASYHLGSVWPHDNAIIYAGMRRYGIDESICIFEGLLDAAGYFEDESLPELFGGFDRSEYAIPVRYPVACHPQAWAAGAIPFMLRTSLGLEADAHSHRLYVRRPMLPRYNDRLEMRGLRVGAATCDLRFDRNPDGTAELQVLDVRGQLEILPG